MSSMTVVHRKIVELVRTPGTTPIPIRFVPINHVAPFTTSSAAVQVGNTLYVSGNIGGAGKLVSDDIEEQTRQALENMGVSLRAAGTDHSKVVKCVCLLADYADFAKFNAVYHTYFPKNYPARMCYEVSKLPLNAKIELDAVAIVGDVVDIKANM